MCAIKKKTLPAKRRLLNGSYTTNQQALWTFGIILLELQTTTYIVLNYDHSFLHDDERTFICSWLQHIQYTMVQVILHMHYAFKYIVHTLYNSNITMNIAHLSAAVLPHKLGKHTDLLNQNKILLSKIVKCYKPTLYTTVVTADWLPAIVGFSLILSAK